MSFPMKLAAALAVASNLLQPSVLMKWDFQGADPLHDLKVEGEAPRFVDDPVRPGRTVMLAELLTNSERGERSEVRWDGIKPGLERWIGVEMLIPEPKLQEFICLFQIGPIRYRDNADKANGGWIQTLQRRNKTDGTDWAFRGFFDRFGAKGAYEYLGALPFGKWQRWIFHIIPRADEQGLIEAWLEDRPVFSQAGKAVKEDSFILLPLKWGVYVGTGNTIKQNARAYYRQVVLADGDHDLERMRGALAE